MGTTNLGIQPTRGHGGRGAYAALRDEETHAGAPYEAGLATVLRGAAEVRPWVERETSLACDTA